MRDLSRRDFGWMASGAAFAQREGFGQNHRPNILFICSDEHAGPYMGCQGHPLVRTPHMDALAARGTLFRNAYSNAPVCVPGRAALMTGRFASDVNSYSNSTCFAGTVPTWGNLLRDAGYHCWATGKLDLTVGKDYGFHEVETDHGHSIHPTLHRSFSSPFRIAWTSGAASTGSSLNGRTPTGHARKRRLNFCAMKLPRLAVRGWLTSA